MRDNRERRLRPGERSGVDGKRVLVTGGSRGLGEQIVRLLAADGARLATCARTPEGLRSLAASLRAEGYEEPFTRALDVTEPELLEGFVNASAERFSGLDGVVACAGGARGRGIEEADPRDWSLTWEMNVGHTARLVKAATPHLRRAGGGSVVVIASISGWKPGPQAQYGAAKAAQIHLAASLARELGPDGIRVNAVSPGSMLIPGKRWDRMRTEDPEAYARFAAELPRGELVTPQEVAHVVAFLLSDASSGISGAHLPVDRAQNAPTPGGY
ncbi:SDR family NAD(P)-dependent oxidoreductase [Streptomyces sp. SRF1]|uniref:SDR family NAD(P)-dependent oxidoreductase n=1 Tax=Streptomyces sp. SRF1 TaxID=1549642 RepID=UPI0025B17F18|nr:SDR family NAD(P)-dependent oxidoreductase [Streptomyces sp. SRF1]MDN3054127.1 SDR family NAD(P)-dependent oxidoreductase [Streptomyces sp. SRF1]